MKQLINYIFGRFFFGHWIGQLNASTEQEEMCQFLDTSNTTEARDYSCRTADTECPSDQAIASLHHILIGSYSELTNSIPFHAPLQNTRDMLWAEFKPVA